MPALVGALRSAGVAGLEEDRLKGDVHDDGGVSLGIGIPVGGDTRGEDSSRRHPEGEGGAGVQRGVLDGSNGEEGDASSEECCYEQQRRQQQLREEKEDRQRYPRRSRRHQRQSLFAVALELYREGEGIARFWRGFAPSLILTCNPAINYTAFDLLKALWLRRRAASGVPPRVGARGGAGAGFLDPVEAFLVAAAAKSLATLITYPLIRAKVILMTCSSPSSSGRRSEASPATTTATTTTGAAFAATRAKDDDGTAGDHGGGGGGGRGSGGGGDHDGDSDGDAVDAPCGESNDDADAGERLACRQDSITSLVMGEGLVETGGGLAVAAAEARGGEEGAGGIREMASVMAEIVRNEGIGGLYAGCGAQVSLVWAGRS